MIGLAAMGIAMHIDYRQLRKPIFLYAIVGAIVFLLIAVLFAPPLNNSRRWIFLAGLSIQPSELAKIAVVLFLAYQIDKKIDRVNQPAVLVPCVSMTALAVVLVLLEPDLGTAGLLVLIAGLMLFLAGLSWRFVAGRDRGRAAGALVPHPRGAVPARALLLVPRSRAGPARLRVPGAAVDDRGGLGRTVGARPRRQRAEAPLPAARRVRLHLLDPGRGARA